MTMDDNTACVILAMLGFAFLAFRVYMNRGD